MADSTTDTAAPARITTLKKRYDIERLVAVRCDPVSDRLQVLVKWIGYPIGKATWEPEEQLIEDGHAMLLAKMWSRSYSASVRAKRYLFVVRFANTRAVGSIYRRLEAFMKRHSATSNSVPIPGNVHAVINMAPDQTAAFAQAFRDWLAKNRPVRCVHAQLWHIAGEVSSVLSVYPGSA